MTVQEAVNLMRGVLNDDATYTFWPDNDLIQFLDQGQRMFGALAPEDTLASLQSVTLLTLGGGTTSLTYGVAALPGACFQPRIARVRWTTTGKFRTALTVPLDQFFSQERSESVGAASEDSPQVAFWAGSAYVSPVSTGQVTEGVQLFFTTTITALATFTDTFAINPVHHPILCEWGISQAFQKIGDTERSAFHRENFYTYVQGVNGKWGNTLMAQPQPRRIASNDIPRGV